MHIFFVRIAFIMLFLFCTNQADAKALMMVQDTVREDMSEAEFARRELLQSDYDAIFRAATLSKISFYTFLISTLIASFASGVVVFIVFAVAAALGQWAIFNFAKKYRIMLRVIDTEHPDYEIVRYIVKLSNFFFYATMIPVLILVLSAIIAVLFESASISDFVFKDYAIGTAAGFLLFDSFLFLKEDITAFLKRKNWLK